MKKPIFVFVLVLVLLTVGLSGCEEGDFVPPVIEVTGPEFETITFQNGDVTLAGTLDLPAGEGPFPAIVTTHGSPPLTRNDWYNLMVSNFFVQHGYAVLRYDKRGVGDSTGKYPEVGTDNSEAINDLADDALAGVEFLKNHNLINPNMIGVEGFSQGGWIAPLAASKSSDVAFAIARSGPTSSVGQEIYYSDLTEEGTPLQKASDMARDYPGPHGFVPETALQNLEVPSLWLFGAQDDSIPVPLSIEILDSIIADQGKDFTYIVYPNGDHSLADADTGAYYPFLLDALSWLDEKFGD
jgi:dipeptidyl aminopeptidase/acylaminoacyl peptidase